MALALTTEQAAGTLTGNITTQVNAIFTNIKAMLANGVPANTQPMGPLAGAPALAASDIANAFGADTVTKLNACITALGI